MRDLLDPLQMLYCKFQVNGTLHHEVFDSIERASDRLQAMSASEGLSGCTHFLKGYKGYKDGLQPESLADGNKFASK